jgi:hypothetical protein
LNVFSDQPSYIIPLSTSPDISLRYTATARLFIGSACYNPQVRYTRSCLKWKHGLWDRKWAEHVAFSWGGRGPDLV